MIRHAIAIVTLVVLSLGCDRVGSSISRIEAQLQALQNNAPAPAATDVLPPAVTNAPLSKPQVCPDPVPNPRGHGLFKPCGVSSSGQIERPRLWLLPEGVRAEHIAHAGEYTPEGKHVRWFRWPGSSTSNSMNSAAVNGLNTVSANDCPADWYFGNRLKLRNVTPATGNILRAFRKGDGRLICELPIVDKTRRHEAKTKL